MNIAIDVGGTFTDLVLIDPATGHLAVEKIPSTPDSGAAVLQGISRILDSGSGSTAASSNRIHRLLHSFTIATNAWLTRGGARVCLVVTEGFKDVLEIGNQQRQSTYDLAVQRPEPLVSRARMVEVAERIDAFGGLVRPLSDDAIEACIAQIREAKPEAIAISLMFSFANDTHEDRLATAITAAFPGIPVYLSSRVNPQIEEYPRANTTAAAAYLGPKVTAYTQSLESELATQGIDAPLLYLRSDGGAATAASARENPAAMLLSGPAGGVLAALELGRAIGSSNLVTFDMGGTSADFAVIANGAISAEPERWIDGLPLRVPMLGIKTISAGGGSVARVDLGGGLRVGPNSAGAQPGPACYGRGGENPTITDAALVIGLLSAEGFAGGALSLDPGLARTVLANKVATPLGVSVEDAAFGILEVANASMAEAIRSLSVERGHRLADFSLLCFGGAGGMFAPFLLDELGLAEALAPLHPGVFAAYGLHFADVRHHAQRAFLCPVDELVHGEVAALKQNLVDQLSEQLARDRIDSTARSYPLSADMRYVGQFHELSVPLGDARDDTASLLVDLADRFHDAHEHRYGYGDRAGPTEIVNLRCDGIGRLPHPRFQALAEDSGVSASPVGTRAIYLGPRRGWCEANRYDRVSLGPNSELTGPAIVEQADSTFVVFPDQRLRTDRFGFVHLEQTP